MCRYFEKKIKLRRNKTEIMDKQKRCSIHMSQFAMVQYFMFMFSDTAASV